MKMIKSKTRKTRKTKNNTDNTGLLHNPKYKNIILWLEQNPDIVIKSKILVGIEEMFKKNETDEVVLNENIKFTFDDKIFELTTDMIHTLESYKVKDVDPVTYEKIKVKLEKILYLISEVDNIKIDSTFEMSNSEDVDASAYSLVFAIYTNYIYNNNISKDSMLCISDIYTDYIKKFNSKYTVLDNVEKSNDNI